MHHRALFRFSLLVLTVLPLSCARKAERAPESPEQAPAQYQQGPTSAPGYGQPAPATPGALPETSPTPEPKAGLDKDEDEIFASVEDAQTALERARAELDGLAVAARRPATPSAGATTTPPAARPKASEAQPAKADSRCANACKAFASLKRAAEGVCRLTSESDERCTKARAIVKQSEPRVAACGCQEPD